MSAPARSWLPDHDAAAAELRGTVRTVRYQATAADSVRRLAGRSVEFARKPDIVASARLLELCEWPCMDAVRDVIEPAECSLGARQRLDHQAPIAIGAELTITARCTVAAHPYSEWEVAVHDGHEAVGRATLAFIVVDRNEFEQERLAPKVTPAVTKTV